VDGTQATSAGLFSPVDWVLAWEFWEQFMRVQKTEALIWITISLCGLSASAPVSWTIPSLIAPQNGRSDSRRHNEFLKPDFWNCRAHHHWLRRVGQSFICNGLLYRSRLSVDRMGGIHFPARQNRTHTRIRLRLRFRAPCGSTNHSI